MRNTTSNRTGKPHVCVGVLCPDSLKRKETPLIEVSLSVISPLTTGLFSLDVLINNLLKCTVSF